MLGVLSDFEPEKHKVRNDKLGQLDRFILYKWQQVKQKIRKAYQEYEYHVIYHTISNFFTIELSSFYLNLMKDNLYCNLRESDMRRATQTTIFYLLKESLLMLAPIMSFTSEEAWEYLPDFPGKDISIHLQLFPEIDEAYLKGIDEKKWDQIVMLRDQVYKEIEDSRNNKKIGDSLEAEVHLEAGPESYSLVTENSELFKEILGVADVQITRSESQRITIRKSSGSKCPRCWNWFGNDGEIESESGLCKRCEGVMKEMNIESKP
jgi:isoleucyl-tRNA synthetase